jgi:hypothetical protein
MICDSSTKSTDHAENPPGGPLRKPATSHATAGLLVRLERHAKRIRNLGSLMVHLEERTPSERDAIIKGLRLAGRQNVPSRSGYYHLRRLWLAAGKDDAALADQRQFRSAELSADALAFFCREYMSTTKPRAAVVYRRMVKQGEAIGWSIPTLVTVLRRAAKRVPRPIQEQIRGGLLKDYFPEASRGGVR